MKNHAKVGNRRGRPAYRTAASFRAKFFAKKDLFRKRKKA